jgi:hypothetical protein
MSFIKISIMIFLIFLVFSNAKLKKDDARCTESQTGIFHCFGVKCPNGNECVDGLTECDAGGVCRFSKGQSCRGPLACKSGSCVDKKCE